MTVTAKVLVLNLISICDGDWDEIFKIVREGTQIDAKEEEEIPYIGHFVSIVDEKMPACMKRMARPSFGFFYLGNLKLLDDDFIKIMFTGDDGKNEDINDLMKNLDKRFVFVLPEKTIEKRLPMVENNKVILWSSTPLAQLDKNLIDTIVNNGGLIFSEIPDSVKTITRDARLRTANAAYWSNYLVVVDGARANASAAINYGLQSGATIGALPRDYSTHSVNNQLISEGADCITSAADINKQFEDKFESQGLKDSHLNS